MAILREPTIYLLGRQSIDHAEVQRFLDAHGATWETDSQVSGELLSELGGRICYQSFGSKQGRRSNADYLTNILEQRHGSVLEHAVWSFLFTGISRSVSHELIRHRAGWSYSQSSQRYIDESETDFVEPEIIAEDARLHALWLEAVQTAQRAYVALAEGLAEKLQERHPEMTRTARRKAAREAARSVLPNATETKIVVTANARALRHFIELRGSEGALPEIRQLAVGLLRIMQKEAPNLFGDYSLETLPDGSQAVRTVHQKV